MFKYRNGMICLLFVLLAGNVAIASVVTGNPVTDGWTYNGHSLENGVYVRGSANYGYTTYSTAITVQSGSNLEISDGINSWLAGDTVLGVGGRFASITPEAAGWAAFNGNAVNVLLGGTDMGADVKLQAKFGTSAATFTTSTVAPKDGNGAGSMGTNAGTGAVQVRTSAYFSATNWSAGSGSLQLLDKASHIERNGTSAPDADVARLIWIWDGTNQQVDSWEIFLNTSLLARLYPNGPITPLPGDMVLMTVQNRDSAYTDALVTTAAPPVPEPATVVIWSLLGGLAVVVGWRRRKSA